MARTRGRLVAGALVLLAVAYVLWRRGRHPASPSRPIEVARGVWQLESGSRFASANVTFVRSGESWSLIDAAGPGRASQVRAAAASLFGADRGPAAILLTHTHPDHAGSARELAEAWDVPVYVHPAEVALIDGDHPGEFASPLDRWVLEPLMRVIPRSWIAPERVKASLQGFARPFDPGAGVPALPGWECVPTPGHTPGHVAFFRPEDRVLISGDALVTVPFNSLPGIVGNSRGLSGPPWYATWDWDAARESVGRLAELEPAVLAPGHGAPMSGPGTPEAVRAFAGRFAWDEGRS